VVFTKEQPDLNKIIAVIGVLESRVVVKDRNVLSAAKELYSMFPGNWDASIADLGTWKFYRRLYFALRKVVSNLIKKKIIP
jgi:hypothetical protein